jgi:hypothetical protein
MSKPKALLVDIETAPILGYVWGLWENNVALNQIKSDWHLLSWAAKWLGEPASKIRYEDQRNAKNIEDDSKLLKGIWKLVDEADILITQNGKQFDAKKLNARFILNGFKPPSPVKHIDTKIIAKKHFGFTSNKLEYMSQKLCTKYQKLSQRKFAGFELWTECLKGNKDAWNEMEKYNKYDVLSLEELYTKLAPWDKTIDFNLYSDKDEVVCNCGSKNFESRGFAYTTSGKFARYRCKDCGKWTRGNTNFFSKAKRKFLVKGVD